MVVYEVARKASIYKIESNNVYAKKDSSTEFIVGIVVYAFVILMASSLF